MTGPTQTDNHPMKILVVEDEQELLDAVCTYLTREGYRCEQAPDFATASQKIILYSYDCCLVDIGLPDGNGLKLIQKLKQVQPRTGSIIISARHALDDKLKGLDIGADDYLTKPFHLQELNARVRSVLRRRMQDGRHVVEFNEIKVMPDTFEAYVQGEPLQLTKKEFDLLLYLLTNRNRVIPKENLAEHLWGDYIDELNSFDFVYTHIKNLRKKLLEKGGQDYLKTIYGVGYKFTDH
jgi:DNA-binding response OmpR family regulator